MTDADPRRNLPSVDALLAEPDVQTWADRFGRETVKRSLIRALDTARTDPTVLSGGSTVGEIMTLARADLELAAQPSLRGVLNGTGVVLHTNLGRASLAEEAIAAQQSAAGYGNVEFALETGERGSRYDHCADLLCELTGAEAAVVTNNNAAAVSLCVNELARGHDVVVSRGELVEIGGSFRIPDVVSRSGGDLLEVGTTNRTRISDYSGALGPRTGMLLRVHPSNYRVEGFADRPDIESLAGLAREHDVPLVHDVGSGLLASGLLPGFPAEPSVAESLAAGADLVTFSGDKLLGGPQSGMIVGEAELIARLRRNPLLRAFRVDKTTLAALEATLMLYRDHDLAARRVPTLRMLRESPESVEQRAHAGLREAVDDFDRRPAGVQSDQGPKIYVERTHAVVGGGSFPGFELESAGWVVGGEGLSADRLARGCRRQSPPLIGRIQNGRFVIDVRTIVPGEEALAARLLLAALGQVI